MLRKFFTKNTIVPTTEGKLAELSNVSNSIISVFTDMIDKLKQANLELCEVANEAFNTSEEHKQMDYKYSDLESQAIAKKEANNKTIEKIKSIIE